MNIPFFNYPALYQMRKEAYENILQDVLSRGAYIMQQDLFDFEDNLAKYLGVKHAIGVADGTMALTLALRAANLSKGSEVIVPSHTFVASAASIHHAGFKPVLVDCGTDHLIDSISLANAVNKNTSAIMPVQLNGRTANMDKIEDIANNNNLKIIEDSCQALGSKYKDKFAGTFGVAGTFSFFPAKTLGCFGDGGAVITDDDSVAEYIKTLRDHGRSASGKVIDWGYNARLDNIHAAILNYKLGFYDEDIERRRKIASIYNEELKDLPQLLLPPAPDNGDHYDIYQNYEIEAEDRNALEKHLSEQGIGTIRQWGGYTIHQHTQLGLNTDIEYTENMTKRFLMLPLHTALTDEEVYYISSTINSFYQK